jgi:hypothetical protein
MFDAASGDALDALHVGLEDGDRVVHRGSAFNGGVYSQVNKDLRQVLGKPVVDPMSRTYCGNGNLADCRTALWGALEQAAADLEAEFGSPNVADWQRQIAADDVRHQAVGVTSVPAIHWINRPTFQQVVQLETGACAPTPASGCHAPAVSGGAPLQVRNESQDAKDRLQWKWQKGSATMKSEFGNPLVDADYRLCIYDGQQTLLAHASAPAGGTCNAKSPRPCWRENATGFRYVDRDLTPDGLQDLTLRAGVDGKARIAVKGKGANLSTPALPIAHLPVTVQLTNRDGACWGATYSSTLKNGTTMLKAKSD